MLCGTEDGWVESVSERTTLCIVPHHTWGVKDPVNVSSNLAFSDSMVLHDISQSFEPRCNWQPVHLLGHIRTF